jgi:glycosyltransferase involved in cell wall biosynthesis
VKVAFAVMGDERWMAGEVIVRNLLLGLAELGTAPVETALLTAEMPDDRTRERYQAAGSFLQFAAPNRWRPVGFGNEVARRLFAHDVLLNRFLSRAGVEVLFGSGLRHRLPKVATLSWLPDFQHRRLPEMFGASERADRDRDFAEVGRTSTRVVLLSKSVQRDFETYLPQYAAKTRVLSPITRVPETAYGGDAAAVVHEYNLPDRFFYLPNQFWRHKNHELVFQAVKNLKDEGLSVTVVCTGFPGDYRNAGHFASLWEKISRWNLRDRVIYLGMVPHDHVLRLIRHCVCVVNPSRFEGWGISVDEARSVGKQVLLSDIAAHREQNVPRATYFDPMDVADLQAKLKQVWTSAQAGPDLELERDARAQLPGRLRAYAEDFVAVANEAWRAHRA